MCVQIKKPEIIVFAGPNGSGKTTVTKLAKVIEPYINADEIKRTNYCTDLEAAQLAEAPLHREVAFFVFPHHICCKK